MGPVAQQAQKQSRHAGRRAASTVNPVNKAAVGKRLLVQAVVKNTTGNAGSGAIQPIRCPA